MREEEDPTEITTERGLIGRFCGDSPLGRVVACGEVLGEREEERDEGRVEESEAELDEDRGVERLEEWVDEGGKEGVGFGFALNRKGGGLEGRRGFLGCSLVISSSPFLTTLSSISFPSSFLASVSFSILMRGIDWR